jgi:UDP-N-acetylmuramate--alanine ligase
MVGLAEVLRHWGVEVQGSDLDPDYARRLEGVKVFDGHDAANIDGAKLVVVSSAIGEANPELAAAKAAGIPVMHRAELLAEVMDQYQSIAVSGTHGKTSTVAMAYAALKAAGLKVGVIAGGILNDLGGPVAMPPRAGDWLVVEADESDASFLKLPAKVAVVTNIEPEHMDAYGSEAKLVEAFVEFMDKAEAAVVCGDDPNAMLASARTGADVVTYGLEDVNDVYASMYAPQGRGMAFDAVIRGGTLEDVVVSMPGAHYVRNALAVLALASVLKLDVAFAAEGLAQYKGVGRRFSVVGKLAGGAEVVDDYAHHPTEIAATLEAAKTLYKGRVVAVIEPHRTSRVRDLMADFSTCARVADAVLVLPLFAAGEAPLEGVDAKALAEKMGARTVEEGELADVLDGLDLGDGDAVVVMGAGRSSKVAKALAQ